MRAQRMASVITVSLMAGSFVSAQVGRGWSDWPTPYADAQRTSWLRTDPNISVESMAKPGFALQWTVRLENRPRGFAGLTQGVTASGVTLFVPTSLIAGSSNNLYMVDNDTGYVVWSRRFEGALPTATVACSGGITAAPTRIVSGVAAPTEGLAPPPPPANRNQQGYRSAVGEPGEGIPVESRGPVRPGGGPPGPPGSVPPAPGGAPGPGGPPRPQAEPIPGAPNMARGGLGRSMVGYVVTSDGQLHVVGLQSGKDLQRPAPFLAANAQWSSPVAVGTMMYAATSGNCAGAPNGVYAIDLDAADKPVVSYRTNGGSVVGAVAFSSDGQTLLAAIGPGSIVGNGKANAIVALDPKTLQLKDWFTQPNAEFVTGPTVFRHGTKDVVAAGTKDGRVILLDAASLGGANHATPLLTSSPLVSAGGTIAAEALSTWARAAGAPATPTASEARWILVPLSGRPSGALATNGAIRGGAVVALRVSDAKGAWSIEPAWTSHDLAAPATPIIVNGVVFALATGRPAVAGQNGSPAVVHAYDGASGKTLWNSGVSMKTFASPGSFWSALSQVYVGTNDGTVHAFGFLDERR
jgi:outer membrane protein assembly factor BamB